MCQMNVLEAKTNFSKILMILETKQEDEVIICKNNKPVAKITWMPEIDRSKFFGIAEGKWKIPDDINDGDDEIAQMFEDAANEDWWL